MKWLYGRLPSVFAFGFLGALLLQYVANLSANLSLMLFMPFFAFCLFKAGHEHQKTFEAEHRYRTEKFTNILAGTCVLFALFAFLHYYGNIQTNSFEQYLEVRCARATGASEVLCQDIIGEFDSKIRSSPFGGDREEY
jgi:hypothetical protein